MLRPEEKHIPTRSVYCITCCDLKERRELEKYNPFQPYSKLKSSPRTRGKKKTEPNRGDQERILEQLQSNKRDGYMGKGVPRRDRFLSSNRSLAYKKRVLGRGKYEYETLPTAQSIRLLKIEPGKGYKQALSCHLSVTPIDLAPPYEALSYAWGKAKDNEILLCDEKALRIRRNLMGALRRMRLHDDVRIIWADAVCINQNDKQEKEHQVKLMRDIYKKATKVLIWLGDDPNNEAEPAFNFINRAGQKAPLPPLEDPSWNSLAPMYRRDWFSRLWVVQEVAMAASAEMIWGTATIPWEIASKVSAWIRTFDYKIMRRIQMPEAYNAHLLHRLSFKSTEKRHPLESFLYMLQSTRRRRCKEPKDRIFALLGLPTTDADPDKGNRFMEPELRKTTRSVYLQLAKKMLKESQKLEVLCAVQHESISRYRPTWVPRWNISTSYTLAPLGSTLKSYAASKGFPEPLIEWTGKYGKILRLKGIDFDSIVGVSDVIPSKGERYGQIKTLVKILAQEANNKCLHLTSENIGKVCCWTVTAGKDHYGMLVTDDHSHLSDFAKFWLHYGSSVPQFQLYALLRSKADKTADADRFITAALNGCRGRRLFYTARGYLGLGPAVLQIGDAVCVLCGGSIPFVLRKLFSKKERKRYILVGEAYVHGLMEGEVKNESIAEKLELVDFEVV